MSVKFDVIYADPPWSYDNKNTGGSMISGSASKYPVLDIKELQKLPINEITNKDSVIFLWVTNPFLKDGIELMEHWGFKFKTKAFSWIKSKKNGTGFAFGMGFYTRGNTEDCLLGIKGKSLQVLDHGIRQIIYEPTRNHSSKPTCVRKRISSLFGNNTNKIELFARPCSDHGNDWNLIGNEIDGKDIRDSIQELLL